MSEQPKRAEVFHATDPVELGLARSLLEAAGIPFSVVSGSASAALGVILGSSHAGLETLVVAAEDEERAVAVLEGAFGSGGTGTSPAEDDGPES